MKKILVIRRDNIGDLVCTTPLIHALREHYPDARIDALVNSYNAPVLWGNPDLDHVYAYTKLKHREDNESFLGVSWRKIQLIFRLRRVRYDVVILAHRGRRHFGFLQWLSPKQTIAFVPPGASFPFIQCPVISDEVPRHEVEDLLRLLTPLGVSASYPTVRVYADAAESAAARQALRIDADGADKRALIGIHISARRVSQRWSALNFAKLMRAIRADWDCRFVLLWSPGAETNPRHPGDDNKAAEIIALTRDLPVEAYPTQRLDALIGALSLCQVLICPDGGTMHLAAGLGKPIVCFFGISPAERWHPWNVEYELLQPENRSGVATVNVADIAPEDDNSRSIAAISVEEALSAFERLNERLPLPINKR